MSCLPWEDGDGEGIWAKLIKGQRPRLVQGAMDFRDDVPAAEFLAGWGSQPVPRAQEYTQTQHAYPHTQIPPFTLWEPHTQGTGSLIKGAAWGSC